MVCSFICRASLIMSLRMGFIENSSRHVGRIGGMTAFPRAVYASTASSASDTVAHQRHASFSFALFSHALYCTLYSTVLLLLLLLLLQRTVVLQEVLQQPFDSIFATQRVPSMRHLQGGVRFSTIGANFKLSSTLIF